MEEARRTLFKLISGVWIVMILITSIAAIVLWIRNIIPLSFFLGELLGSMVATGLFFHMYRSIDIALDIGPRARFYTMKAAFIRSVILSAVLLFAVYFREVVSPFGTFLGLFGMKLSVYIQPLFNKLEQKKMHKSK